MKKLLCAIALGQALALIVAGSAGAACDPDEIKIGEDRHYDYCLKTRVVGDCKSRGGDVQKCVNAACVRTAGENLGGRLASCREESTICAGELGVPTAGVVALGVCLASAAAANPETCWAALPAAVAIVDVARATCRAKYGRCVEPSLAEHKSYVAFCNRYQAK